MKKYAFYLPQFHKCKENDEFWGENFTDWVTTSKATPLFRGHTQPLVPTELGYYDLADKEVIIKQAKLAKEHGVNGFAIYYYWFDRGVTALDKPIKIIRDNPEIDIDYFITWANHDWSKSWVGDDKTIIFKQKYNQENYNYFFESVESFLSDQRYVRYNNKPVIYIYEPRSFDVKAFIDAGDKYFKSKGYEGITWVAPLVHVTPAQMQYFDFLTGYPPGDAKISYTKVFPYIHAALKRMVPKWMKRNKYIFKYLNVYSYEKYSEHYIKYVKKVLKDTDNYIPTVLMNWDNTPRYELNGFLFEGAVPKLSVGLIRSLIDLMSTKQVPFVLIKAWNEWAEGNVIEPTESYGREHLEQISKLDKS